MAQHVGARKRHSMVPTKQAVAPETLPSPSPSDPASAPSPQSPYPYLIHNRDMTIHEFGKRHNACLREIIDRGAFERLVPELGPRSRLVLRRSLFQQATAELGLNAEDMRPHLTTQQVADLIDEFVEEEDEFDAVLSYAKSRKVLHSMPSKDVERFLLHMGFTAAAAIVKRHGISGEQLSNLNDEDLAVRLGLSAVELKKCRRGLAVGWKTPELLFQSAPANGVPLTATQRLFSGCRSALVRLLERVRRVCDAPTVRFVTIVPTSSSEKLLLDMPSPVVHKR